MRILRIVLLLVLLLLIALVVGGVVVYNDLTRSPLPQTDGSLSVAGLDGPVEVLREANGIAHIYASTTHDLFFAQGFTHAQDRWWQMEFSRHIGRGAIQELTGQNASVMGTDVFVRTAGWLQAAERDLAQADPESVAILQAFADGVNAYITSRPASQLALEYRVLGVTGVTIPIEPWTPVDSVVWGKVLAWNLTSSWSQDADRATVLDALGAEMLNAFNPPYPYGERTTILHDEDLPIGPASAGAALAPAVVQAARGMRPVAAGSISGELAFLTSRGSNSGIGSNNWVATGAMTDSGTPLLANDPHLGIQMPAIWYEIGLHCQPVSADCPFDVRGFTFPANPGVVIGHNGAIAWGVTNVGADVQDLYRLEVNPDNPLQYRWDGAWRDMTVREETVRFGDGGDPVTFQVRETHLGPIINDNTLDDAGMPTGFNNNTPTVLRWTAHDPGTLLTAVLRLNRAQNWQQFREALTLWDVPAQNFVYADTEGNIGYQTPGRLPIRPAGNDGTLPVLATSDADVWQGFIPFDSLPRIYNPDRDYIATANQAVVPPAYYDQLASELGEDASYLLSYDWAYGQRGQRIEDQLNALAPLNADDYRTIQGDIFDTNASVILPRIAAIDMGSAELNALRDWLTGWDTMTSADSPQAALWNAFAAHLVDRVFNDQLPDSIRASNEQVYSVSLLLGQPDSPWWDDSATDGYVETAPEIVAQAFSAAQQQIVRLLGADRDAWRWGALHRATFVSNPLGLSGIDLIENMVNRGPVEVSGGIDTVNAIGFRVENVLEDDFSAPWLPSMRQVIDPANWDASRSIITTGQSGHPFSPHYSDQIAQWAATEYHPMLFTRGAVEAAAVQRLLLQPAS